MSCACLICNGMASVVTRVKDAKDGEPIDIALCKSCGHVQLAEIPDLAMLQEFYEKEYRKAYRKTDAPKPRHVYRAGLRARSRVDKIMPHIPAGTRLLDIGAGGGEFVYLSNRAGLSSKGIDPASGYLEHARVHYGVDLRNIGIEEIDPSERYGLITLFHVLEHLRDPAWAIATIADHLEDQGLLYLEVPDLCSRSTSPSNFWFKAHLSYFTEATLRLLVEQRFEVIKVYSGRVLEMILRKRIISTPIADLPARQAAARAISERRLREKTFTEYLLHGGMVSPFSSLRRILAERAGSAGRVPLEILDSLHFMRS
jgi:2-polyprenyl-3-methyl-5-hydroxy-6-metoxy-1,4-benzoquinol methylase